MSMSTPTPLCPTCGKPAHSGGPGSFECSAVFDGQASARRRAVQAAPEMTHLDPKGQTRPAASSSAKGTFLAAGTFVGEYRIEDLIGEGGMGTVYRAVQPLIGKRVAVKVLAGVLAQDKTAIQRFVLEARAVNEIGHKNLIDIFSFGQLTDGRYYYVMEYLEGKSLGAILRARRRLHPDEAFPIFRDIARALEAAHAKGIVHRDLKPDNVILVPDGEGTTRAKLLDFGLAKLLERREDGGPKTDVGSTLGTPQYMAPEQCVGGRIDARADIYALGVMLFQTLCGRVPFDGASLVDIWQAQVRGRPPKPTVLVPGVVTPELEALILKMLSKDVRDRPQSAGEFCTALSLLVATGKLALDSRRSGSREAVVPAAPAAAGKTTPATPSFDLIPIDNFDDVTGDSREAPTSVELPNPMETPQPVITPRPEEIDDLRTALGLTIAEPAFETPDPTQASALTIDLGSPPPGGEAPVLLMSGPVHERRHLPALAPPGPKRAQAAGGAHLRPGSARRKRFIAGIVVLALGGLAAAAAMLL